MLTTCSSLAFPFYFGVSIFILLYSLLLLFPTQSRTKSETSHQEKKKEEISQRDKEQLLQEERDGRERERMARCSDEEMKEFK